MRTGDEIDDASTVLTTTVDAPRHARAFVRSVLERWEWAHPEGAVLAASEAVSQSVLTADSARVAVAVSLYRDRRVQVRVHDDDPVHADENPRHSVYAVRVINELADVWGVDDIEDDGKVLWIWLTEH